MTMQEFRDYNYNSDAPHLLTTLPITKSFIKTDMRSKINEDQI
jgi:hypothetical protein